MSVPVAYFAIVVIWSTTPLAIQWSGDNVGYEFGVAARMAIGLIALLIVIRLFSFAFPWDRHSRRIYLVGGTSIFIAMSFVYWSARYIPSGWISVIFGLTPIVTGIFTALVLKENAFSGGRLYGMLLGLIGLAIIFTESIDQQTLAWFAVMGVLISVLAHSVGAVGLRRLRPTMPSISVTAGSLIVSLPLFVLNWLIFGPALPESIPAHAFMSIVYLGLIGSTIGFPLYFYALKHSGPDKVALITLITPVTALMLGSVFNDESINFRIWLGTAMILIGLAIHAYGNKIESFFYNRFQSAYVKDE